MVEYLFDCIRAVAGLDISINALITDEEENIVTEDCYLILYDMDGKEMIYKADGVYNPENLMWDFLIPADVTLKMTGRFWYCIQHNGNNLCFKQPIYLV